MSSVHQFENSRCRYLDDADNSESLRMFHELAASACMIVCDLETTGLDPRENDISIIGIGLNDAEGRMHGFLFDQLRRDWSTELKPLLENPDVYKLMHNGKFDWKFMWSRLGIDAGPLLDTMQTGLILDNGLQREDGRHSLEGMAKRLLNLEMNKDESLRESFVGGRYGERQLRYASLDLYVPAKLWGSLHDQLDHDLENIVALEGAVIPPTGAMELNGFRIDQEQLDTLETEIRGQLAEAENRLPELKQDEPKQGCLAAVAPGNPRLKFNSPKQIKEFFLAKFGVKLKATDENTLKNVQHAQARELCNLLLQCRGLQKNLATYTGKLRAESIDPDGRLRGRFDALGAAAGRFSSSGPNLQNFPRTKAFRRLFIPDPGNVMVLCDYSQIELRVVAELAGEETMIRAFQRGDDLHRMTAARMFDKSPDTVTPEERQRAKAVNFGLIYAMRPRRMIAEGICKTVTEAEKFVQSFFTLYPRLRPFHRKLLKQVNSDFDSTGKAVDFRIPRSGRRRWLTRHDLRYDNGDLRPNVVVNTPVQCLAADGFKQGLARMWPALKTTSARMLAVIHDEVVLECPEQEADNVKNVVRRTMIEGMQTYIKEVPILADAVAGKSWADK